MNFITPELQIHVVRNLASPNPCLYFKFTGKFSTQTSISAAKNWSLFFEENPEEQIEFVWDCKEMTGFELNARKEWYKAMQKHKRRILKVHVISDQLMIRSAAKVMLQFFGIPSEISRSGDELPIEMKR